MRIVTSNKVLLQKSASSVLKKYVDQSIELSSPNQVKSSDILLLTGTLEDYLFLDIVGYEFEGKKRTPLIFTINQGKKIEIDKKFILFSLYLTEDVIFNALEDIKSFKNLLKDMTGIYKSA